MDTASGAIVPLIATLIGGLLAIVSARLSAKNAHELTLKRENAARRCEKAEELYALLLKLRHESLQWRNAAIANNFGLLDTDGSFPEHEKQRIRLICDLYIPALSDTARKFMDVYADFGVHALAGLSLRAEKKPLIGSYSDELTSKYDALEERIDEFRVELAKAVADAD